VTILYILRFNALVYYATVMVRIAGSSQLVSLNDGFVSHSQEVKQSKFHIQEHHAAVPFATAII